MLNQSNQKQCAFTYRLAGRSWLVLLLSLVYYNTYASNSGLSHETSIDYTMYRLATEQNDPSAQYLVGRNYLKGKSVERNVKEAIKWFEMAAKQNHIRAQYQLGKIYLYGEGVKQNLNQAYFYLAKAAEKNHLDSQFELGNFFLKGDPNNRQYEKAVEWFRRAAKRDHVRAYYELGSLVYEGKGTPADKDEGIRLLTQAVESGYMPATAYLNNIENGIGNEGLADLDIIPGNYPDEADDATVSPDDAKTQVTAASQTVEDVNTQETNTSATTAAEHYKLGLAYLTGDGQIKQVEKAAEHFLKAANENHGKAQYQLAKLYQQGIGVAQSDIHHRQWLEKAAKAGVQSAARDLKALQGDKSFVADDKKLTEPEDLYTVGIRYYYGQGVEKDPAEAAKWFIKAANKEHPRAQYQLGLMYKEASGVEYDLVAARQWFQKAAKNGLTEAQVALTDLSPKREVVEMTPIIIKHNTEDPLSSQLISENASPIASFLTRAKNGDRVAQYEAGVNYLDGTGGVTRDIKQAVKWLETAANNNHVEASTRLGLLYYRGDEVDRNYQEAARWLEKAATQGDAEAQLLLGDFFRNGFGVEKNSTTAVMWYRKSANQGNREARKRLGGCRIC